MCPIQTLFNLQQKNIEQSNNVIHVPFASSQTDVGITNMRRLGPRMFVQFCTVWSVTYFPFIMQDPRMDRLTPIRGPLSGGTKVTIIGQHIKIGSSRNIKLFLPDGQRIECKVIDSDRYINRIYTTVVVWFCTVFYIFTFWLCLF